MFITITNTANVSFQLLKVKLLICDFVSGIVCSKISKVLRWILARNQTKDKTETVFGRTCKENILF